MRRLKFCFIYGMGSILLIGSILSLVSCRGKRPLPTPLTILSPGSFRLLVGNSIRVRLQVTGGAGPYSWSGGNFPAGVAVSTAGVISGTLANPTAADGSTCVVSTPPGSCTYHAQLTVTDALKQSASATVSFTVPLLPLKITTTTLPDGQVGQPYTVELKATGGLPAH